jgi:hypothetical protein
MQQGVDPTFNRSPGAAIAAPPESLPYVAAFDSAECDAIAVVATIAGLASPAQGAALAITSTSQIRFSSRFRTAAPQGARGAAARKPTRINGLDRSGSATKRQGGRHEL